MLWHPVHRNNLPDTMAQTLQKEEEEEEEVLEIGMGLGMGSASLIGFDNSKISESTNILGRY